MTEFDQWFKNRHTKSGLYEEALCGKDDATYIRHEMCKAYLAGQRSQQAKIDELEFKLSSTVNNFDNSCKTIAIHQKFLDDADVANKFLTYRVDGLQDEIQGYKRIYGELEVKRDELQANIDESLEYLNNLSWASELDVENVRNILKGNKDEN